MPVGFKGRDPEVLFTAEHKRRAVFQQLGCSRFTDRTHELRTGPAQTLKPDAVRTVARDHDSDPKLSSRLKEKVHAFVRHQPTQVQQELPATRSSRGRHGALESYWGIDHFGPTSVGPLDALGDEL